MTTLAWLCVAFGVLVALCILAVCIYDPWAVATGAMTVSDWCLETGQKYPWVVALLTAALTLPLGVLIGHLWFPQTR